MSMGKIFVGLIVGGFVIYNVVDDKTRAKFDNGWESQQISLSEMKNDIYFFFSELGGVDKKELDAEKLEMAKEIKQRKEALAEKEKALDENRSPASEEPTTSEIYTE